MTYQQLLGSLDNVMGLLTSAQSVVEDTRRMLASDIEKFEVARAAIKAERESLRQERDALENDKANRQRTATLLDLTADRSPKTAEDTAGNIGAPARDEAPERRGQLAPSSSPCSDVLKCEKCKLGTDEDSLMLCDGRDGTCNAAWHYYCADLPEIPAGDWFCPSCAVSTAAVKGPVVASTRQCQHGKLKQECNICSCPHGRGKGLCKICTPCPHGKVKYHCRICTSCPHGNLKYDCKVCKAKRKRACMECRDRPGDRAARI